MDNERQKQLLQVKVDTYGREMVKLRRKIKVDQGGAIALEGVVLPTNEERNTLKVIREALGASSSKMQQ